MGDRQFVVEPLDAQRGETRVYHVSGILVVASRVTGTMVGAAASLVTWLGNEQAAAVGATVGVPPAVRVVDANGLGVAGSTVTWEVGAGSSATATGLTGTTDSNGVATVGSWSVGTTAGQANTLLAYSGNLTNSPIGFSLTPTAASAFSITASGGTSQTTTPAGTMASRLTVLVHDQYGNPVNGATVTLSSNDSGGSPAPAFGSSVITTNSSGVAGTTYQAGTVASVWSVYAAISSATSARFAMTTVAGSANAITVVSGDNQVALSGATLALPVTVSVDDGFGNTIGSGNTLQYVIVAGSGNLSRATQTPTSSAGSVEWAVGSTAGINLLEISLANVSGSTVTVTASGTDPEADTIAIESGNSQTGTVGAALALPLAVAITASGSSASGQVVTFALGGNPGTAGSLSTTVTQSSATGVARAVLTLGTLVGTYTVQASAGTLTGSPVVFSATATADSATSLVVSTQPSSQVDPGVVWASQPVIVSTDVYGNLVSTDTRVQAVLVSGGGTLGSGVSTFATASGATATFSGLSYNGTGAFQTAYRCNSLSTATASVQTAAPPIASQLAFTVQPGNLLQGGAFNPTVQVAVQDSTGVTVTTATDEVTVAMSGGGTLSGTTKRNAVSGLASFSGLGVDAGTATGSYTLAATAPGLTGATSTSFNVSAPSSTNEPAGMTALFGSSGVTLMSGAPNLTFADIQFRDASTYTAPAFTSGTTVINGPGLPPSGRTQLAEIGYAAGHPAGSGSGTFYRSPNLDSLNAKSLYVRFYFQLSNQWYGESSGALKLYQPLTRTGGANNRVIVSPTGAASNALSQRVAFQSTVNPGTTGYFASNIGQGSNAVVTRGQWHQLEVLVVGNTAGTPDGVFRMWLDGVKIHDWTDRQYDSGNLFWRNCQVQSVYGGQSTAVPYIQYIWIASPYYASYSTVAV